MLPTELSLYRALSIARWASWFWTAGVAATNGDDLRHPVVAWAAVVAAFAVAVAGTVGVRSPPGAGAADGGIGQLRVVGRPWVGGPLFTMIQAVVAFALVVADGWAFEPGHAFATSQNLAAASPTIAAVALGVWGGIGAGVIGGVIIGFARLPAALVNDVDELDGQRWTSILSSALFIGLAGGVVGWLANTLRRVETEVIARRERDTIARTLHDTVLQTLALVARRADDPDMAALARRTDAEVRQFLYGPTASPTRSLSAAIHAAATRAAQPFDLDLVVNVVDDAPPASGARVEALATAVGEAVTNAGKHAGPVRVVVYAEANDDGLFASVRDEGPGFDPSLATAGQGIRMSIRGPVEALGGRAEISRSDRGVEVRVWVP